LARFFFEIFLACVLNFWHTYIIFCRSLAMSGITENELARLLRPLDSGLLNGSELARRCTEYLRSKGSAARVTPSYISQLRTRKIRSPGALHMDALRFVLSDFGAAK
jgi:hypothetical protein